jgi:hypothetical protein
MTPPFPIWDPETVEAEMFKTHEPRAA